MGLPIHGRLSKGILQLAELGCPPRAYEIPPPSSGTVKALHELVILFGDLLGEAYENHADLDLLIKMQVSGPMKTAIYVRQCATIYRQNASSIVSLMEKGIKAALPRTGRKFVDHVLGGTIEEVYFAERTYDGWG